MDLDVFQVDSQGDSDDRLLDEEPLKKDVVPGELLRPDPEKQAQEGEE
jgi:hypothetical protein